MQFEIARKFLREFKKKYKTPNLEQFNTDSDWDTTFTIESNLLKEKEMTDMLALLQKPEWSDRQYKRLATRIRSMLGMLAKKDDPKAITCPRKLADLKDAIQLFVAGFPHHWIFCLSCKSDENFLPYLVTSIQYKPPERHHDGYVQMEATGFCRGKKTANRWNFWRSPYKQKVQEMFDEMEILMETPELVAEYEEELARWKNMYGKTGTQFLATGHGITVSEDDYSWYRSSEMRLDLRGEPQKVIMDDTESREKEDSSLARDIFRSKEDDEDDDDDDDIDEEGKKTALLLPVHPVCRVFALRAHAEVDVHVSNLQDYVYDTKITSKLVLSGDRKELIDILVNSTAAQSEDIIRGKSKGVVILCSGQPGTGKTLTAECFSEVSKRPLYTVQCAQLGVDAPEVEKSFSAILDRATRFKCILLIDEADVYIHERGEDINQNAVVGVFLRLLEYYDGVLFLTTNRATIVDDAIVSRCMAHVRYSIPATEVEKAELWSVLSAQFKVTLSALQIERLVKRFPKLSGRSIKQMLKLGKMMAAKRKTQVDENQLIWVGQFLDIERAVTEKKKIISQKVVDDKT